MDRAQRRGFDFGFWIYKRRHFNCRRKSAVALLMRQMRSARARKIQPFKYYFLPIGPKDRMFGKEQSPLMHQTRNTPPTCGGSLYDDPPSLPKSGALRPLSLRERMGEGDRRTVFAAGKSSPDSPHPNLLPAGEGTKPCVSKCLILAHSVS